MEEEELKNKFIELRSSGRSFEEISAELGVSVQKLADWTREYQDKLKRKDCGC